jgi:catechol 2,3-dioxygenase-like lactoylglutathione lyase family enzyme
MLLQAGEAGINDCCDAFSDQKVVNGSFHLYPYPTTCTQLESGVGEFGMLNISGLYELAIRVKNLKRSEEFYRSVLGLEEGLRDDSRNRVFLRTNGNSGMIVLQEDRGQWPSLHFAFTVAAADITKAAEELREKGLEVEGPVFHEWMPAYSVYFPDPDGHQLELCAPV